jgi:hypothetical protein
MLNALEKPDRNRRNAMPLRAGVTLTFEGMKSEPVVSLRQIEEALDRLRPLGPSYLILDAPGGEFAQAAGSEDAFTAEWSDRSGHCVAGLGHASQEMTAIPTSVGHRVRIYEHERLPAAAVKHILKAFAEGRGRPAKFAWRALHLDSRKRQPAPRALPEFTIQMKKFPPDIQSLANLIGKHHPHGKA